MCILLLVPASFFPPSLLFVFLFAYLESAPFITHSIITHLFTIVKILLSAHFVKIFFDMFF